MRTASIAMLAAAAILVVALPALAADESDTQNTTIGGTIPELCQIGISGNLAALLTLTQDGTGEPAYDAGYIESGVAGTVLTLDANKKWQLGVNYDDVWTCPNGYNKAETDLLIKITSAGTGTIENGFGVLKSPIDTKVVMLDHTAGVSNDEVDIQTRVNLDWTKDIPGVYSITLVYTMETTP
jgi:hypothetical protein